VSFRRSHHRQAILRLNSNTFILARRHIHNTSRQPRHSNSHPRTYQLAALPPVVDANQNGPSATRTVGRHNAHGPVDVNHATAAQFGNLVVAHLVEFGAHLAETGNPRVAVDLVSVQDLQKGARAGPAGFAGGIGELELMCVERRSGRIGTFVG